MNTQYIDDSLNKFRSMFEQASKRIEALKPGERVPATVLADEIGKEHSITGEKLYPVLLMFLQEYPNTVRHKGARGGVEKLFPKEEAK